MVRGADQNGWRSAIGFDRGGAFGNVRQAVAVPIRVLAVLYAVAVVVLIAVFDAVAVIVAFDAALGVLRSGIKQHAAGDVAGDSHGGTALQQVVGVQFLEVEGIGVGARLGLRGRRRKVTIAGGGHAALKLDAALDVTVEGDSDSILALGRDTPENRDVARHRTRDVNAVAVVADHVDRAEAGQVPRQRGFDRQACGIIALYLDGAGAFDQDVSRQARRTGDAYAKAVGSLSERAVKVAVLVGVRVFRDGIGNVDCAAHRHIGGVAALDQDAGCAIGGLLHLDG
ncbi:hypothetical protein D3C85_807870 [compost metagenome]